MSTTFYTNLTGKIFKSSKYTIFQILNTTINSILTNCEIDNNNNNNNNKNETLFHFEMYTKFTANNNNNLK